VNLIPHRAQLGSQQKFLDRLVDLIGCVQRDSGHRKKKIEKLRVLLSATSPTGDFGFSSFDPLPLPLDPDVKVVPILLFYQQWCGTGNANCFVYV